MGNQNVRLIRASTVYSGTMPLRPEILGARRMKPECQKYAQILDSNLRIKL